MDPFHFDPDTDPGGKKSAKSWKIHTKFIQNYTYYLIKQDIKILFNAHNKLAHEYKKKKFRTKLLVEKNLYFLDFRSDPELDPDPYQNETDSQH